MEEKIKKYLLDMVPTKYNGILRMGFAEALKMGGRRCLRHAVRIKIPMKKGCI
jgi:hypothetical protein